MFSVIVLSYNSDSDKMRATLDSVLKQKYSGQIEIIIADDGSKDFSRENYVKYFEQNNFLDYLILEHENYGIVNNVLDAVKNCRYELIKPIGAGDILRDSALEKVEKYFQKYDCAACTVWMTAFQYKNGDIHELGKFNRPCMMKDKHVITAKDAKNILVYEDYMSGASLFYKKNIALKYLSINARNVRSCEDLMQVNILLDGHSIGVIKEYLVDYEYGTGVSTNLEIGKAQAVKMETVNVRKTDHELFYEYIGECYSDNKYVRKLLKRRKIEAGNWLYRKTSNIWFPEKLKLKQLRKITFIKK